MLSEQEVLVNYKTAVESVVNEKARERLAQEHPVLKDAPKDIFYESELYSCMLYTALTLGAVLGLPKETIIKHIEEGYTDD